MSDDEKRITDKQVDDKKQARGASSFRIPKKAIDLLIQNKATAWQIGAFLTLARFTDESGKFSSAGHEAIYRATGASPGTERQPGTGRRLVMELLKMGKEQDGKPSNGKAFGILYMPEEWKKQTGEEIPERPGELSKVRWVLNDFGDEDWVWFGVNLVDGIGRFTQPLKRLKQCGDVAARLLLLMYQANNMEEFGGVPSYPNVYQKYDVEHWHSSHNFTFWRVVEGGELTWNSLYLPALGIKDDIKKNGKPDIQPFWDSLKSLDSNGFIYSMITVMDGHPDTPDARPLYELHPRTKHNSQPPKGEEGMAARIDLMAAKLLGDRVADELGRFIGTYPVISRAGIKPHVAGIYRLRFRVSNPKNYGVSLAWQRIHQDRAEVIGWIEHLEKVTGITNQSPTATTETTENLDATGVLPKAAQE